MKFIKSIIISCLCLVILSCSNQISKAQILIKIPTIEEEATSIWRTINDIEFLEKQGYKINLPDHEVIKSLLVKSKNKEFGIRSPIYYLVVNSRIIKYKTWVIRKLMNT